MAEGLAQNREGGMALRLLVEFSSERSSHQIGSWIWGQERVGSLVGAEGLEHSTHIHHLAPPSYWSKMTYFHTNLGNNSGSPKNRFWWAGKERKKIPRRDSIPQKYICFLKLQVRAKDIFGWAGFYRIILLTRCITVHLRERRQMNVSNNLLVSHTSHAQHVLSVPGLSIDYYFRSAVPVRKRSRARGGCCISPRGSTLSWAVSRPWVSLELFFSPHLARLYTVWGLPLSFLFPRAFPALGKWQRCHPTLGGWISNYLIIVLNVVLK